MHSRIIQTKKTMSKIHFADSLVGSTGRYRCCDSGDPNSSPGSWTFLDPIPLSFPLHFLSAYCPIKIKAKTAKKINNNFGISS